MQPSYKQLHETERSPRLSSGFALETESLSVVWSVFDQPPRVERSLGEVRRRTKVIGRFPGETSCLSWCWAVLDLVLAGARGLGLSDLEHQLVAQLKLAHSHPDSTETRVA